MPTRPRTSNTFDLDPDFPDRIMGWACLRTQPWDLAGFLVNCADAHALREAKGSQYIVRHGTKRLATDDFKCYREDECDPQ